MISECCNEYAKDIRVITADDPQCSFDQKPRIAIQVHVFHADLIEEIALYLRNMPVSFDCYVSTDDPGKSEEVKLVFGQIPRIKTLCVEEYENSGRDVAPFVIQMSSRISNYDYICHVHTKKSLTVQFGDAWRRYLLDNLLGGEGYIARLFDCFDDNPRLGIIMPGTYPLVQSGMEWSGARGMVESLINETGLGCMLPDEHLIFPAGDMFWARVEAVVPLFEQGISMNDFPEEANQTNNTLAHAIERVWCYLALANGFTTQCVLNGVATSAELRAKRLALYIHYDPESVLSSVDLEYIKGLKEFGADIVVISNGGLDESSQRKLAELVEEVIVRDNEGYDFGAWRDVLLRFGRRSITDYDEVVLCNNSCVGPLSDLRMVFNKMDSYGYDFWGLTLYPHHEDASILNPDDDGSGCIPEHLQSYFLVLTKKVTTSDAFWDFWTQYAVSSDYLTTILNGELLFTQYLSEHGFSYGAYLPESLDIGAWLGTGQPQNELGLEYVVLGAPFIKKKNKVFLTPSRKRNLASLLEQMSCEPYMIDYFDIPQEESAENFVLSALVAEAQQNQDRLRVGKRPSTVELPVEDFYWYVVEDYTVDFSQSDFEANRDPEKILLNWIVPPMGVGSGGHVTLFRFLSGLEQRGFHSRFYLYGNSDFSDDDELRAFLKDNYEILDERIEAFNDVSSIAYAHISIATEWKTAYFLKRFNNTLEKVYFVQDYEPFFYPHGSEYQFAEDTYRFGFSAITAGDWLKDIMSESFGMEADSFHFSANRDIYHPREKRSESPKVFFYARPVTPRRDFELGMLALRELCKIRPDVTVEFAGWDVGEYVIPFKHHNHGIVPSNKLAEIYAECDLCLVLSATNLSLVPLEVMACGSVAVCSDGPNSTWLVNEANGVIVPEDPVEIAQILSDCLVNMDLLEEKRTAGMQFALHTSWEEQIDKVASVLRGKYDRAAALD